MKILHYTLGLPPNRSGGLTKYATDLMIAQQKSGLNVSLLYPGDYIFWKLPSTQIVKDKTFKGVSIYKINNPAPVPLLHGISQPSSIYNNSRQLSEKDLENFYKATNPDVFHIHTLMGLPFELLHFLKRKGVKLMFTTHDYFGLCLKVNFIDKSGSLCNAPTGKNCANCNSNAPSSLFLRLRNSNYLLKYKNILSSNKIKQEFSIAPAKIEPAASNERIEAYDTLITYYLNYFKLIDCFHYNSNVTKGVYEQYIHPKKSTVIPISHATIMDNRTLKFTDPKNIRLAFIGSTETYKGFPLLKEVLIDLKKIGVTNWTLDVWGGAEGIDLDCEHIFYKGKYLPHQVDTVYQTIDLLIVPSVWNETFSLITLEAISRGIPVLVTTHVGAKDIVQLYNPEFIVPPTKKDLVAKLKNILEQPQQLNDYSSKIVTTPFNFALENHLKEIRTLYKNLTS